MNTWRAAREIDDIRVAYPVGRGMITSSPTSTVATSALNRVCLPPALTLIWFANRRGRCGVELVGDRVLRLGGAIDIGIFGSACVDRRDRGVLTKSGVSKSGSPAER